MRLRKINAPAVVPVGERLHDIRLREVEVFGKLPRLGVAACKGLSEILHCQKRLGRPAVRPVLAALYRLEGAFHPVQRSGGDVTQLVVAYAPEKLGGTYLREVQKDSVETPIPHGDAFAGALSNGSTVILFSLQ